MTTPNLGLPNTAPGATDVSIAFNEAMQIIDTMFPLVVQAMDLTAPPATVAGDVGKRWIPAAGATGDWAGHAGEVALCTAANVWAFFDAPLYHYARDLDTAADYRQAPLGTWTVV